MSERMEIEIQVGYEGKLLWPPESDVTKVQTTKLFREVLPDEISDTERFEWSVKNPTEFKQLIFEYNWKNNDDNHRSVIDAAIREGKKA